MIMSFYHKEMISVGVERYVYPDLNITKCKHVLKHLISIYIDIFFGGTEV